MKLDAKWLLVAGTPILIALIIGGYIKTFKGLGLELEANLKKDLPESLITKFEFIDQGKDVIIIKGPRSEINELGEEEKNRRIRIRFVLGRRDYYKSEDIVYYLERLTKLKYIEIVNEDEQFKCLLPIDHLHPNNEPNGPAFDNAAIDSFVTAIQDSQTFKKQYPKATKDFVFVDDTVLDAYKKVSKSYISSRGKNDYLPVLDSQRKMIGIVLKNDLERKISQEVLRSLL
ncbi:CBS domain-containing protein [Mucilaginibacter agri]|uniref:CBS domain-containing protein n=1 Tax=Mucilaginibacter agri TaxID=2695265 RepID=A0A965ZLH0_9SPHI|nr:CBS domain-containing protein [Mucilaginibacter agri]NCD71781.1 hypothetical protein [Mucilaginibacter agri]